MKPGYKQTEVGVIPEEWGVAQLGDLKPFVTSGAFDLKRTSPLGPNTFVARQGKTGISSAAKRSAASSRALFSQV